jgi:hypothetical protein
MAAFPDASPESGRAAFGRKQPVHFGARDERNGRLSWLVLILSGLSGSRPRINATSCVIGTGFMEWMPMNCPGRSVTAASRVIEMEDVLVAITALGCSELHSNILRGAWPTPAFTAPCAVRGESPKLTGRSIDAVMFFTPGPSEAVFAAPDWHPGVTTGLQDRR